MSPALSCTVCRNLGPTWLAAGNDADTGGCFPAAAKYALACSNHALHGENNHLEAASCAQDDLSFMFGGCTQKLQLFKVSEEDVASYVCSALGSPAQPLNTIACQEPASAHS